MAPEANSAPAALILGDGQQRLDRLLAQALGVSRAQVQRAISEGRVTVDGVVPTKSAVPRVGAVVRVSVTDTALPVPEAAPRVAVLYADSHLAVIDKPPGLAVYGGSGHRARPTLLDSLRGQFAEVANVTLPAPERPGIVHRLDADTSGAMVVGLTDEAVLGLLRMFKRREVTKDYLALVQGHLQLSSALIDAPLVRDPVRRVRMSVTAAGGREARTLVRVVEHLRGATLIEARLLTGRTHQIRVHLASAGHPVLGDRLYGPRRPFPGAERQMLHAWRLEFIHPIGGEQVRCEAPMPADMKRLLDSLRR